MTTISNRQIQKLLQKLSPQQIQMIKLLELPSAMLEQRIKQEIEENPALEECEAAKEEFAESRIKYNLDEMTKESHDSISGYKLSQNNRSKDDKTGVIPLSDTLTLAQFLEEQLGYQDIDEHSSKICKYLIGSIDTDGYLRREIALIVDDLAFIVGVETTESEVELLLELVQSFEPAGVGSRNLKESLLIQLKREQQSDSVVVATKIIENYFEEFSKKHYDKITPKLAISTAELKSAIAVITSLSPKPANQYAEMLQSEPTLQIIPDFILECEEDKIDISLNRYNAPDIKVNTTYIKMLEGIVAENKRQKAMGESSNKEASTFIRQKIDSAKWFISAIKQRDATLMLTVHAIVQFQHDYFLNGDETKLRPMILKDIAEKTSLDVSTISRVVNSKYIQTHFGIYPLKYFFSEAMQTESGEEVSSREIKQILQNCVDNEDKSHPLTDEALMEILQDKGYKIARRTVAKYREMSGIAVARLRREVL